MSKKSFAVKHNLDQLSKEELVEYLREVSEFIGLDPDLNGLDTIWMNNETGPGRSLVVYARRGTAEILRNIYGVEVESLTYAEVRGSMVFTATGRAKKRDNRQEIAIGSKYINGYAGKELDDCIMTASTRALRRLTMQFTTLGILDESEVVALLGHAPNPAGSVQLAPNSTPPVFAVPTVPANNAPGKPVEADNDPMLPSGASVVRPEGTPFLGQPEQIAEAIRQVADKQAKKVDTDVQIVPQVPVESTTSGDLKPDTKPDTEVAPKAAAKPRRKRNTVSLEVEPEVVQKSPNADILESKRTVTPPIEAPQVPAPPPPAAAPQAVAAPAESPAGLPTTEQMAGYKAKIGVYTQQLPASDGMTPQQKMRAFITRQTSGVIPQNMTPVQWETVIGWFDGFAATNGVPGLIKFINDTLGVK